MINATKATVLFHQALLSAETEISQAVRTADGFFVDSMGEVPDSVSEERRAILTGSGFERVADGRWFHPKSGAIVSGTAVEQLDLETLRSLLALSFVGGTAMDARVTRRFQETHERIRELEEKVQDRQRFF